MKTVSKFLIASLFVITLTGCVGGYYAYDDSYYYPDYYPYSYGVSVGYFDLGDHHGHWGGGEHWGGGGGHWGGGGSHLGGGGHSGHHH